jgi:hypothetical protein
MGDSFLAFVYASPSLLESDELCLACRKVLDGWDDDADINSPAPITWLDVEEIPPSIAMPVSSLSSGLAPARAS